MSREQGIGKRSTGGVRHGTGLKLKWVIKRIFFQHSEKHSGRKGVELHRRNG